MLATWGQDARCKQDIASLPIAWDSPLSFDASADGTRSRTLTFVFVTVRTEP